MFSNSRVESRERAFFQGNAEWMRIRRDVGSRVFGRPADWSQPVSAAEVVALPELLEEAAVEETHSDLDEDEDEEDEQGSSSGAPLDEEAWDELQRRGTEVEADASLDEDGAVAPDESVPGSHGGGDAVAEALAASAAIAGGSSRRVVEWAAVQDAPVVSRVEATVSKPTRKTMKLLRWMLSLWRLWMERKDVSVDASAGPTWEQANAFFVFASGMRQRRCLANTKIQGLCKRTLIVMIGMMLKHVLPTLYPALVCRAGGTTGG